MCRHSQHSRLMVWAGLLQHNTVGRVCPQLGPAQAWPPQVSKGSKSCRQWTQRPGVSPGRRTVKAQGTWPTPHGANHAQSVAVQQGPPPPHVQQTPADFDRRGAGGGLPRSEFGAFVGFFRQASPYIAGHRGRIFVVVIPGHVSGVQCGTPCCLVGGIPHL